MLQLAQTHCHRKKRPQDCSTGQVLAVLSPRRSIHKRWHAVVPRDPEIAASSALQSLLRKFRATTHKVRNQWTSLEGLIYGNEFEQAATCFEGASGTTSVQLRVDDVDLPTKAAVCNPPMRLPAHTVRQLEDPSIFFPDALPNEAVRPRLIRAT